MMKVKQMFSRAWQWRLKKKWHVFPFMLVTFTVIFLIFNSFHFTLTDSLDKHAFYVDTRFPQLELGDYVTLDVTYPYGEIPGDITITKIIACMPGQYLKNRGLDFFCDDVLLGSAKEETMSGVKTDIFQFDGLIPYGKLFLAGPHEYSFDSKYFGLVEVSKLKMLLKPLL